MQNDDRQLNHPEENERLHHEKLQKANRIIQSRTMWIMLVCGVLAFLPLFFQLFHLMIFQHDELELKALRNQTKTVSVSADRGVIYDCNMNILASSTAVETVFIDPNAIEKNDQDLSLIASGLSKILGVSEEKVRQAAADTKMYYKVIKRKIPTELGDEIRAFIADNKLVGIHLEPDKQRYYPYETLAAQIIGFVDTDNRGVEGLEGFYDTTLTGTAGKTITTKGNNGSEMLNTYEKYYDATDGNNIVLTIDSTVQYFLEKNIENAIEKYSVLNGGFGIVMDVNTGDILGMATLGSYDPNRYAEIYDADKAQQLEEQYLKFMSYPQDSEEFTSGRDAYNKAMGAARLWQWRNRAVSDGYEPGSTFKLVTLASALNEGAVSLNDSFYCGGAAEFVGRTQVLHCWKKEGHGTQTTEQSLGNSCNIAFANIGLKLGGEKFYDYVQAFGLMEKTGVDLPGEAVGYFYRRNYMNPKADGGVSNIISASFGQSFKVTPLQMVRAVSAIVNGGYVLEPHIVSEVVDSDGNTIMKNDRTVLRQVISENTSKTMRQMMEAVVTTGTASRAKTAGYRIGGKTGTSEKLDEFDENGNPVEDLMVSFIGVAPINDPKYVTLVVLDTPSTATGLYISGGIMAAPTVRDIFTDILPYLGVEPDYSDEEISAINVVVPNVTDRSVAEAEKTLNERSLTYRTVGDGETVTGQIPAAGAEVPGTSEIILYCGEEVPTKLTTVPDFMGMTVAQAKQSAKDLGLYLQAHGTDRASGWILATYQSIAPGTEVDPGTTVTIEFTDNSVTD